MFVWTHIVSEISVHSMVSILIEQLWTAGTSQLPAKKRT